jgi:catechol 2,3-dioxygenase-like lactoylglutathione lyase family enzyme
MNLNQVTVPSSNVEKSMEFYKTLGLTLIVKALPQYVRFECTTGDATFSIHKINDINKSEGAIVYFEQDNLDDYVKDMISKGIVFDEMPEDRPWLWREARLKDPDGNKLIIYHAGDNRKNPPWRINSQ